MGVWGLLSNKVKTLMEYLKIPIDDNKDNKRVRKTKNDYYGYKFKRKNVSDLDLQKFLQSERSKIKQKTKKVNTKLRKSKKKKGKQRKYKNRVPRKYSVYIKSIHWENRKNRYWREHGRQCCVCGSYKHVQLHHGKYGWTHFGNEPDDWMFPMCNSCHFDFHENNRTKADMLAETLNYIEENWQPHDSVLK